MQWYKTNFCNRRDWILDNAENLNLTNNEIMFCLMIDFLKEHHIELSNAVLMGKLKLSAAELDQVIRSLSIKGYLDICSKEEIFDLTGLFESDAIHPMNEALFQSVFDVFEDSFGRPLSSNELVKLSDLSKIYQKEELIEALRTAEAYNKISMPYIEGILRNLKHE